MADPTDSVLKRAFNTVFNPKEYNFTVEEHQIEKIINEGIDPGAFCTKMDEDVPNFVLAGCELEFKNSSGASIVLGKDRPESRASGCGGAGETNCASIDLVVGRGSGYEKRLNSKDAIGPSFSTDAARIYITQKSKGIDSYFGLNNTKTDSVEKSAIGLKADHTRIIGRESVRIYAGGGQAFTKRERLANRKPIETPGRIELIVGGEGEDYANVHPVVLGNNLVKYLTFQSDQIQSLVATVGDFAEQLAALNGAFAALTGSPPYTTNILKNINQIMDTMMDNLQNHISSINALDAGIVKGADSILSNTVFTT
tara:strand:+ start:493 stop:1428 length:936 start_codon:yes stop_codon:yes gene_type:complete